MTTSLGDSSPASLERASSSTSLPTEFTRFIGREGQRGEVRRLIEQERLVTLTGPGGIGKTRLALELASSLRNEVGIAWVELAGISESSLLLSSVGKALGVDQEALSISGLADHLPNNPLVICLDGCEHLVDHCAHFTERLLSVKPSIRILATSREALGVKGERAWLVPPLDVPPAAPALDEDTADSVQLFMDRARDVVPGFALTPSNADAIGEICRRLDGIPLALEIAAARIKVLTPLQIRDRLDDMFRLLSPTSRRAIPRHRTLTAAMAWTYELLPELPKTVFRRLSVFRGGFDLSAAEAVASGEELPPSEVLEHIALLVDRSLVLVREFEGVSRYYLLEPIRQYAAKALSEAGEWERISERHARWYLTVVHEAAPDLTTASRRMLAKELQPELANLRYALTWTRDEDPELHIEFLGWMWWVWLSNDSWAEARAWLEPGLDLPPAKTAGPGRARLLFGAGALDALQARPQSAQAHLAESISLADEGGDGRLSAYARTYLGLALVQEGAVEGEKILLWARDWFEANDDLYGLRFNLIVLGNYYAGRGDLDLAAEVLREGVDVARSFGLARELAVALESLAILHLRRNELSAAEPLLIEALGALFEDWGPTLVARVLQFLGIVRGRQGGLEEAGRFMGAAEVLRGLVGSPPFPIEHALVENATRDFSISPDSRAFEEGRKAGLLAHAELVVAEIIRAEAAMGPTDSAQQKAPSVPDGQAGHAVLAPSPSPLEGEERRPESRPIHASHDLAVLALGPLEIWLRGDRLPETRWPFSKPRELLLFLTVRRQGWRREELSRALWPDSSPAQLKNSFHVALHHLRKTLGDQGWVVIEGDRYRLSPQRTVYFDLDDFEGQARETLSASGPLESSESRLREILSLFRGEFGVDQRIARWHDEYVDKARALRRQLGLALGDLLERQGRYQEAAEVYRQLASQDELHEAIQRRLMLALARSGQRAEALRYYERLRELLSRELEAEPEDATRLVWDQIRAGATQTPD